MKIKELDQFADFLVWTEKLKETAQDLWLKPISEGKWSLREILTHIMYWDKDSLEMMVPNMSEGANLTFVDIEQLNQEAAAFARSYDSLHVLIDDLIQIRKQLLHLLAEKYDEATTFIIDNQECTYKKFVQIFIHHDEHHKKQIEAFLKREEIA